MSKEIDDLLKNRPEVRGQMQQATKEIDTRTMPSQAIEGNPHPRPKDIPNQEAVHGNKAPAENAVTWHDNKSMPNAYDQQPAAKGNEVDKVLSERDKSHSQEAGKELNQQHQVSQSKSQDMER